MNRIRAKLTYSNVVSSLCLVLVLGGGTAYAATELLPKGSVGTKQIQKGAVTPAKLSKKAKATLTSPQGPQGIPGAVGPVGPRGPQGADGPEGAPGPRPITLEDTATSTEHTLGVFDGIRVYDRCAAGAGTIGFQTDTQTSTLEGFGLVSTGGAPLPEEYENAGGFATGSAVVQYEITLRNTEETNEFTHFALHIKGSTCALTGMVIPPS